MCHRFGTRSARGSQTKLRPSNCTCAMPRKRCCFVSYMMQYHETANEDTLLTNARIQIIQTRQERRGRRECGAAPLETGRKNPKRFAMRTMLDGFTCRSAVARHNRRQLRNHETLPQESLAEQVVPSRRILIHIDVTQRARHHWRTLVGNFLRCL